MKLASKNSYKRSIGVILIAENVRWDIDDKMQSTLSEFLHVLQDDKLITVRRCIQSLLVIVQNKPQYSGNITNALLQFDVMSVRDSIRTYFLLLIRYIKRITNAMLGLVEMAQQLLLGNRAKDTDAQCNALLFIVILR